MIVMKFGGASVKDADSIRNVAGIILNYLNRPNVIVISAAGKTTNNLEILSELAKKGDETAARATFDEIKNFHLNIIDELFEEKTNEFSKQIQQFFIEIERLINGILLLEEFSNKIYDRIVSYGELMSTSIVANYLRSREIDCEWIDARRVIKTDANFKQANLIWSLTEDNIQKHVLPSVFPGKAVITQGFIGSTISDNTTTLGREGSDYTASIFANCLNAESLTVWKDVAGILNADPRIRKETIKLDYLSYEEAVEMTFYGASVIHPKTIKPLFNKKIPLRVKCFNDIQAQGSEISSRSNPETITSYIVKKNQIFIKIKPKDFSFMDEKLMEVIFDHVYKTGVKVNLVQNSAISLLLCMDHEPKRIRAFQGLLIDQFELDFQKELKLYTVINFAIKDLKQAEGAFMVQQNSNKLFIVK